MWPAARKSPARSVLVVLNVLGDIADGGEFLGLLVGDLVSKLLFQGHHQLHGIQRVGAQILDDRITVEDAAEVLSDVAATVIRAILPATAQEFERAHGAIPGSEFAVVAFGNLGAGELGGASSKT